MMTIGLHYEVAAVGFFFLLFLADLLKRKLPSRQTITFHFLLLAMMLSTCGEAARRLVVYMDMPEVTRGFIEALVFQLEIVCFLMFDMYICAFVNGMYWYRIRLRYDFIALGILTALVLSTPWTGFCFRYDENGEMQRMPVFWLMFGVIILVLFRSMAVLWRARKKYTIRRIAFCYLLTAGFFGYALCCMLFPGELEPLGILMAFLMYAFYLSLQSPDFYVDNVTGAFNRNGFFDVLRERMAYRQEMDCLLVRVRNYNSMNQIYGEDILHTVQCLICAVLEEEAQSGVVYHIGASTFAVMYETQEPVVALYERLVKNLPTEWQAEGERVRHEYSFYQLCCPDDGNDAEELIQRIHYARSDHENHHEPGQLIQLRHDTIAEAEQKKKVAHFIEETIMDNTLELNFQPIFSLEKKRVTSFEVLSRLKDENKKYINPEFFIHVAEENHTIIPLGEQIFEKACAFAARNHVFELGIEDMNVNLSPAQCRYEDLTERFVAIAGRYDIPMERIHLEITESEFTDSHAVEQTLKRLKESGAKVAMDDFGTGSSMLSNILELPVDYVKIDKSLVWSFAEGKNQFLNDLMPLIRAEGKRIIAEGIETEEHIRIIQELSGDFLQGYYFSRPLPEREFMNWLKNFHFEETEGSQA